MVGKKNPHGHWTKERCIEEALKYRTRTEFNQCSMGAYLSAQRKGWLDEITQHMNISRIKWDMELCRIEALKYSSRTEFHRKSGSAYGFAIKYNFLNEICQHMRIVGSLKKRCIYSAEFTDGFVYVGLTYNFNKRTARHLVDDKSQIYGHILISNNKPIFKKLTKYDDIELAQENEQKYVNFYREKGWEILNIAKTGAIGGSQQKWTKESCLIESLKYKTKTEFQKNSCGAHSAAYRNNWLNEVCEHMTETIKPKGYWDRNRCCEEALKYKTRKEFQIKSGTSYRITRENGWLDDVCKHMSKNISNI